MPGAIFDILVEQAKLLIIQNQPVHLEQFNIPIATHHLSITKG
jgi:hypothetical protein